MKEKILIWVVCMILLISFIHAEGEIISPKLLNIGEAFGFTQGNEIFGWGMEEVESIDRVTFNFAIEDAQLSIKNNLFKNIIPKNEKLAYITVNKSNAVILEADFTTNNKGGNYTIGGKTLNIPPNSRVYFDGKEIKIDIPDGADLIDYPGLFKFLLGSSPTIIEGNDVILPNGAKLNGEVNIEEQGYFLKEGGILSYNGVRISADDKTKEVLIANWEEDLNDYDKNSIKMGDKNIEINSIAEGEINLEIMEGNYIFNTFKPTIKRNEDGTIFVDETGEAVLEILPDKKDNLKLDVSGGDILKISSRKDVKKIPFIIHKPSMEGSTNIENGRLQFILKDGELEVGTPKSIKQSLLKDAKPESVAFQLNSPNLKKENSKGEILDYQLRVNSANVFAILDPQQSKQRVAFNSRNFEVNDDLTYNLAAQSLDYLNAKYETLTFFNAENIEGTTEIFYEDPSPQLIQMVDKWFEEDPRRTEFYNIVEFTGEFNSAAGYKYLMVGEQAYDLYATEQIRDITDPRWILTHEHQHETDLHVEYEESMQLNKILRNDPEAQKLSKEAKKADKLLSSYFRLKDYHRPDPFFDELFLTKEELEIPLQERNMKKIQEYEKDIQDFSQNIYMALREDNKNSVLAEDILTEVYNQNQKRHEMYNLLFDPNVEKISFLEADPLLEELAEISTDIKINLNGLEQILIEGGYDKEIVNDVNRLDLVYYLYDGTPTTGIEAQINWFAKENLYGFGPYQNKRLDLMNKVPYLEEQFATYVSNNPKTKKLEHIYSDLAVDIAYDIMHDDEMRLIRNRIAGEIKQKLIKDFDVDFWEVREDLTKYDGEGYWDSKGEVDFELALISHAAFMLQQNSKEYSETEGTTYNPEKEFLSDLTFQLVMLDDTSIESATKEASMDRFGSGSDEEGGLPPLGDMFKLQYKLRSKYLKDDPIYKELSYRLEDLYEVKHGVPAAYSFFNYGNTNKKYSGRYSEIASTYREQPIEVRRQKVQDGTDGQKRSFGLLTQTIFDAGEMDINEFVQIMGLDYDGDGLGETLCSTPDCIEYRCVNYKFLCCQQYPESPNC